MNKEKLTTAEIIDMISAQAKVSKKSADDFLKILFETIEEELLAGNQVKIKDFGTFKLQWNEARKSVNVNTGEEIILPGYNKVTFLPDASLKDLVNQPFAHLEPIALDEANEPVASEPVVVEEQIDPLRIFNEQATEIKDILSELQAMSSIKEPKVQEKPQKIEVRQKEEEKIEIKKIDFDPEIVEPEFDLVELDEEPEIIETKVVVEEKVSETKNIITPPEHLPYQPSYSPSTTEITETPDPVNEITVGKMKPQIKKKKSKVGWIILIVLLLGLSGSAAYMYFYPPAFCWCKYKVFTTQNIEKVKQKGEHVKEWFIVQKEKIFGKETPKVNAVSRPDDHVVSDAFSEPDSAYVPEPVDTLMLIFNQRASNYTQYLGSERIQRGSRLTYISQRYYGNKEFWVYIYEANKEKIENPDNVRPGTLIRIPKMDKKLIDEENPRCLELAKQLHDLYINKKK
jgi:nucleoid DNA-binding protein/nucleoid-associated protein YgaU